MEEKFIREEVRRVLRETLQQDHPAYAVNGASNKFPYHSKDDIIKIPEEIDTKDDYLVNWNSVSENQDLYGFPMKEFEKGIHVEKAKREIFGILDIAEIVVKKLKENPLFYSNLGV